MSDVEVVIPEAMRFYYDHLHFAPAVKLDGLVICSGVLGLDEKSHAIADPEAQFRRAFETLGLVLSEAGMTFADVVEITTFHIGMGEHMRLFTKVKDEFMAAPYPAMTSVGVTELAVAGALVEIKAIARARRS